MPPLPVTVEEACPHPRAALTVNDAEVIARRLGLMLIDCEGRRAAAVAAYNGVRDVLAQ